MARLDGKSIVITGSSRSLGRQFALACAREGASLIINGTNRDAVAEVEAEIRGLGNRVASVVGSVAEESVAQELVQRCIKDFGGIDVLVNNAGIVRDRSLLKMTAKEFDEVIAVDQRGPFLCMREAAKAMVKQEQGGHIIQITSGSGLVGNFGQTNYAAAKAGMIGMMYTAVKELAKKNVRCNAMWPIARTDMTQPVIDKVEQTAQELGFGEPEDVALALEWLASDAASHWNGQCMTFNGSYAALWQSPREKHTFEQSIPFSIEELNTQLSGLEPLSIYQPQGDLNAVKKK